MTPDDSLKLLIAGLTGIFAFVGTWAGSRFSHSSEHRQWLRNEKLAVCVHFIGEVDRILTEIPLVRNIGAAAKLAGDSHRLSLMKLTLVCPAPVVDSAQSIQRALTDIASLAVGRREAGAEHEDAWASELSSALQRAGVLKARFMLESIQDLNSGMFYGLGILRPTAISLLRMRLNRMDSKLAYQAPAISLGGGAHVRRGGSICADEEGSLRL